MSISQSPQTLMYHSYPLGMCGAPPTLRGGVPQSRLQQLRDWIPHWQSLGINRLYLGPVFTASTHGYDTISYTQIDPRLGTNELFANLVQSLSQAGIQTVVDGVFHHVGREFFAFQDVLKKGVKSDYCDWFYLDFNQRSPYGDPFGYACWEGHEALVKLNLRHPAVKNHLFTAIQYWIEAFGIAGIRLDVAYALDATFIQDLRQFCQGLKPDFWLLGEVIHGDYRQWLGPDRLDSVTNYECYKGLYSSHNDRNYFEIAYSLNRLFGPAGIYRDYDLYNFVDNHDVARVASILNNPTHLYPLYILLMTIPGIPSLYYGSEIGLEGDKHPTDDRSLRPALNAQQIVTQTHNNPLFRHIQSLCKLRQAQPGLSDGDYQQIHVNHEQLAFRRATTTEEFIIVVNMAAESVTVPLVGVNSGRYQDVLNPGESFEFKPGSQALMVHPCWGRILKRDSEF